MRISKEIASAMLVGNFDLVDTPAALNITII